VVSVAVADRAPRLLLIGAYAWSPRGFAVAEEGHATAVASAIRAAFRAVDLPSQSWLCGLDTRGARIL